VDLCSESGAVAYHTFCFNWNVIALEFDGAQFHGICNHLHLAVTETMLNNSILALSSHDGGVSCILDCENQDFVNKIDSLTWYKGIH
jgi:hypothetical protein